MTYRYLVSAQKVVKPGDTVVIKGVKMANRNNYRKLILSKIRAHGRHIGMGFSLTECFCALYDFWELEEPIANPFTAYNKISKMMDAKMADLKRLQKNKEEL